MCGCVRWHEGPLAHESTPCITLLGSRARGFLQVQVSCHQGWGIRAAQWSCNKCSAQAANTSTYHNPIQLRKYNYFNLNSSNIKGIIELADLVLWRGYSGILKKIFFYQQGQFHPEKDFLMVLKQLPATTGKHGLSSINSSQPFIHLFSTVGHLRIHTHLQEVNSARGFSGTDSIPLVKRHIY